MDRRELIDLCLTFPGTYEDYPFKDSGLAVVRHLKNRKIFAWIYLKAEKLYISLKEEPMQAEFWRRVYPGISPGYHLNKQHWNTIDLACAPPMQDLLAMIKNSHTLTAPKAKIPPGTPQH